MSEQRVGVGRLGLRPSRTATAERGRAAWERLGYGAEPRLRTAAGAPVATDNGGLLYDLSLGVIGDPPALAAALKAVTGVVEHGLFLGLAAEALIGGEGGVQRLAPAPAAESE